MKYDFTVSVNDLGNISTIEVNGNLFMPTTSQNLQIFDLSVGGTSTRGFRAYKYGELNKSTSPVGFAGQNIWRVLAYSPDDGEATLSVQPSAKFDGVDTLLLGIKNVGFITLDWVEDKYVNRSAESFQAYNEMKPDTNLSVTLVALTPLK